MTITNDPYLHEIRLLSNVLIKKNDKYLVLKRSSQSNHAPNMIHAFGGHVDHGENPLQAAKREIKEELGIEIKNLSLRAIVTEVKESEPPQPDWVIFHFSADYDSSDFIKTHEGELLELNQDNLLQQQMLPSFRYVVNHILNSDHIMFATYNYKDGQFAVQEQQFLFCK